MASKNSHFEIKFDLSFITSVVAIILSIYGLIYTHLSYEDVIKPHLNIGVGETKSPALAFGLFVQNNGRGPAKIESITSSYKSKKLFELSELKNSIAIDWNHGEPGDNGNYSKIEKGMEINNGDKIFIYSVIPNSRAKDSLYEFLINRITIEIAYSSQHQKKYKVCFP